MAVSNFANVSILLGTGGGAFGPATSFPAGSSTGIGSGDFNGDGKADLAVTSLSGNLFVFLGNGDGTFQPVTMYPTGKGSDGVTVGDFNRDGTPDIAVSNPYGNSISVLLGRGDGTFRPAVNYRVGNYPRGAGPGEIANADLNGDGALDLVVELSGAEVLLGNGDGTFRPGMFYPIDVIDGEPATLGIGDFNGDGKTDVAVTRYLDLSPAAVMVFLGKGDGTLQAALRTSIPGFYLGPLVSADLNGDGYEDIVVAAKNQAHTAGYLFLLLSHGDGTFEPPVSYPVDDVGSIALTDLRGTGSLDLLVVHFLSHVFSVYLNECAMPDLTVSMSHATEFTQGQAGATYSATVSNSGAVATTQGVKLAFTLPSGLTATALSGSGWTCATSPLACTRGDSLASGAHYPAVTLHVNVANDARALLFPAASVSGGGESDRTNDTAIDRTAVKQVADLSVAIQASAPQPFGGTTFTYIVTVTNHGPGPATGLTVTTTLPPTATLLSTDPPGLWSGNGKVTCAIGDLAAGKSSIFRMAMRAPVEGGCLAATATVSASENDPDTTNNSSASATTMASSSAIPLMSNSALLALAALLLLLALCRT